MLIIQKPNDYDGYFKATSKMNKKLQENGFMPTYYDGEFYYYLRSEKLDKFVRWRKLIW